MTASFDTFRGPFLGPDQGLARSLSSLDVFTSKPLPQHPDQAVATFRGALTPHPAPTQPTRTTPSTAKSDSIPISNRLAQFNEFYRQYPRRPLPRLHSFALVGTPDRMLFIIVDDFLRREWPTFQSLL